MTSENQFSAMLERGQIKVLDCFMPVKSVISLSGGIDHPYTPFD